MSFNGGNEKSFLLFRSLNGGIEWVGGNTYFCLFSPKLIFTPPKIGRREEIKLGLLNFLLKLSKYPYTFNHLF